MKSSPHAIVASASICRWRANAPTRRQLVDRLQRVAADAHQLIYRQGSRFSARELLRNFLQRDFPRCVHRHRHYVLVSAVLFFVPLFITCWLTYARPDLILSVVDSAAAQEMEFMYSPQNQSIGAQRDATSDWAMFGFYIRNNIGIAFRCFAAGLFLGVGSIFFLVYNGAVIGAVGGFLTARGLGRPSIRSWRRTRRSNSPPSCSPGQPACGWGMRCWRRADSRARASLVQATREAAPLIYGFTVMLLIAAAVEAFWSSSRWIRRDVKYSVAGACWAGTARLSAAAGTPCALIRCSCACATASPWEAMDLGHPLRTASLARSCTRATPW